MSLLVEIRRESLIVNGTQRQVGEIVRLPSSLALALSRNGGCVIGDSRAHLEEAREKRARQKDKKGK